MKKNILLLTLSVTILAFSACKKTPIACISTDKTTVLTGESIAFTSCATDANRTVWDFGDGSEKTEGENTTHTYNTEGVYLVTATSYSKKDKKTDKISTLITVNAPPPAKDRYLTKVILKGFPAKKADGNDWDGTSFGQTIEPEVYILLKLSSGESWELRTSSIESTTTSMLPYTWDYTPQNVFLSNTDWSIEMNDDDALFGVGGSELMADWTSNLSTESATGNIITFTNTANSSGDAIIELHFMEK